MKQRARFRSALAAMLGFLTILASANVTDAQTPAGGTCAWWEAWQEGTGAHPADKADPDMEVFKGLFAEGLVLGTVSNIWMLLEDQDNPPLQGPALDLFKVPQVGDVALLQKPDLLRDGLNPKCGDYRNAQIRLPNLALVVTLEIGGDQSRAR